MNKALGGVYQKDERVTYNFSFYNDDDGKHVEVRFRAEPDWDLDTIFNEFRNFLIASGHDIEGQIGELHHEDDWDNPIEQTWEDDSDEESIHAMKQYQSADKFTMDHLPNNGWPFGGLTTASLPTLTSVDLSSLSSQSYAGWSGQNQYPTMSPITTQQIQSWSLSSADIKSLTVADLSAWTVPAPGTIGGAKIEFK
jgi:hypothetical protein